MLQSRLLVVGAVAACGATCFAIYYFYKRRKFNFVTDFEEIGTVSQITLYPVKSMKGVQVQKMECRLVGGKSEEIKDRHFMVVDADTDRFITGRQIPKLVTLTANVKNNVLSISDNDDSVTVNIGDVVKKNIVRRIQLFNGQKQDGIDCGDEVADFLRKALKSSANLRLVHYVDGLYSERDVIPQAEWMLSKVPERCDPIAYTDECPYMAICESSLEELNSHFNGTRHFDMRSFRPVIQIAGAPPFDEDFWEELKIGDVIFSCYKPCARCVMITIDPDTGLRTADNEPLKTLRRYRLAPGRLRKEYKQSPVFGVMMGAKVTGTIRVGDKAYARHKTHPH